MPPLRWSSEKSTPAVGVLFLCKLSLFRHFFLMLESPIPGFGAPQGLYRPTGAVVASPAMTDSEILLAAIRSHPALRLTAPFNRALPLDVWFELYTFRPKVPLTQAVMLAGRTLVPSQIDYLWPEKRPTVWSAVRAFNYLDHSLIKRLGATGRYDSRIVISARSVLGHTPASPVSSSALTLTEESASHWPVRRALRGSLNEPTVTFLKSHLRTSEAWENFFVLADSFEGSVRSLVDTCNALT